MLKQRQQQPEAVVTPTEYRCYEYDKQHRFRVAREFLSGFCAGRGSGKTVIGARRVLTTAKAGEPWMCIVPNYATGYDSAWTVFIEEAQNLGVLIRHSWSRKPPYARFHTQDGGVAELVFKSAEEPESLRGPSKAGLWFDEASIIGKAAYDIGIAVLRYRGQAGSVSLTFTPRGRKHWTYDKFCQRIVGDDGVARDVPREGTLLVRASTKDNPFVSAQYYDNMLGQYSTAFAEQELEGEFVDIEGLLFNREWFDVVDMAPRAADRIRYWDKAATPGGGSFTAGALLARSRSDGLYYVEDVTRGQWSAFDRDQVIRQVAAKDARRYNNEVLIYCEQEPGSGGKEAAQQFVRMLAGYPVYRDVVGRGRRERTEGGEKLPGDAKIVRAQPFAAQCEARNVRLCKGDWNYDFLDELCLAEGTQITTIQGEQSIENIQPGTLVLTRQGWRPVEASKCTSQQAETWELRLSNGRSLTGTANHPVWVKGRGFTRIEHVRAGDELLPSIEAIGSTSTPMARSDISLAGSATSTASCTSSCGRRKLARSRPAITSTTRTATQPTTCCRTSSASRRRIICDGTLNTAMYRAGNRSPKNARSAGADTSRRNLAARLHAPGSATTNGSRPLATSTFTGDGASVAGRSLSPPTSSRFFAARSALERRTVRTAVCAKKPASFAGKCSNLRYPPESRAGALVVLSSATSAGKQRVFNLQVAEVPEYFANGVLVHNCAFPESKQSDQVDAAAAAFNKLAIKFGVNGKLEASRSSTDRIDPKERYGVQIQADAGAREDGTGRGWKNKKGWFKG